MRNEYWVTVAGGRAALLRAPTAREAAEFECAKNVYVPGTVIEVQERLEPGAASVRYIIAQDAITQERYVTLEDERDTPPRPRLRSKRRGQRGGREKENRNNG